MTKVRLAGWAVVAIGIALSVVLASRFGSDPDLVASPLIGQPAPNLELPRLDGAGTETLRDPDDEVLVVNFFASWCLECRFEHADLVAIADQFADSGVRVVQIAYQDTVAGASGFLDELGRSAATTYLDDPDSRAAIAFGVFGVPETYFVDAGGTIVGKIQGESNALLLGETIDRITAGEEVGQQVTGDVQSSPEG